MRESAGWTASPLSAMGSPRYSPDSKMDGHTPTRRRREKEEGGNGYITRGGSVCVILGEGWGMQCNNT